jgi:PAS domain S-box-containing protein
LRVRPNTLVFWIVFSCIILSLRAFDALLFHTVIELFTVAVALGIVAMVRNTRRYHDEDWFLLLGAVYPFVGALDLAHVLTYPGLGFGGDVEIGAQLWVVARVLEGLGLLLAVAMAGQRVNSWAFASVFAAFTGSALLSVMVLGSFPDCVGDGGGPTVFRVGAAAVVVAVLVGTAVLLVRRRARFSPFVGRLLGLALVSTIASEVMVTLSAAPGDGLDVAAHLMKVVSMSAVYRAVIEGVLSRPYEVHAQALDAQAEMRSRDELEAAVSARTEELARAADRLAEAEQRYRTVADFTFDWEVWEDADGSLQYVSPSCRRITGYRDRDFLDEPALIDRLVVEEDRARWQRHRASEAADPRLDGIRVRIRRADGSVRWIEHMCQPVTDKAGRFRGIRASNRDITGAVEADEAVRRARDELTHLQRVSTVGELAATLAHEINQPLAGILSNAQAGQQLLQAPSPDVGEAEAALADIVSDARRASAVVERIRSMLRKGPRRRTPVDVNEAVMEVLAMLRGQMTDGRTDVALDLAEGLPTVLADRIQVQQVVMNLVRNALDALGAVSRPRLVVSTSTAEGGGVRVRICDNGVGIPLDLADDVFEPFLTSKEGGLGMGLAISRSIVEEHGGQLWVEHSDEDGSALCFELVASPSPGTR